MKLQGDWSNINIEELMGLFSEARRERNLIKSDLLNLFNEVRSLKAEMEKMQEMHKRGSEHNF